jgi:VRR-NUC domain-containing protein
MPMNLSPGRALLLATISEEEFLQHIINLAKVSHWFAYHTRDSRKSARGWPDLVLLRPPRAIFVETKSATGVVSNQQKYVLGLLQACGFDVRIWRPADEAEIESVLT